MDKRKIHLHKQENKTFCGRNPKPLLWTVFSKRNKVTCEMCRTQFEQYAYERAHSLSFWRTILRQIRRRKTPTIKQTVAAYIKCGRTFGYAFGEAMLNKFSPEGILEAKCYQILPEKRADFIAALQGGPIPQTKLELKVII